MSAGQAAACHLPDSHSISLAAAACYRDKMAGEQTPIFPAVQSVKAALTSALEQQMHKCFSVMDADGPGSMAANELCLLVEVLCCFDSVSKPDDSAATAGDQSTHPVLAISKHSAAF